MYKEKEGEKRENMKGEDEEKQPKKRIQRIKEQKKKGWNVPQNSMHYNTDNENECML